MPSISTSSGSSNWTIIDSTRDSYNQAGATLDPNVTSSESPLAATADIDILSNGFKCRLVYGDTGNANGAVYIYAAFAENPFKYALARGSSPSSFSNYVLSVDTTNFNLVLP